MSVSSNTVVDISAQVPLVRRSNSSRTKQVGGRVKIYTGNNHPENACHYAGQL